MADEFVTAGPLTERQLADVRDDQIEGLSERDKEDIKADRAIAQAKIAGEEEREAEKITLDDMKARDIDNLETIMKDPHRMLGRNSNEVMGTIFYRLGRVIDRATGHTNLLRAHEKFVQKALDAAGVKVENRRYTDTADLWRSGIYVYKGKEIIAFYGEPRASIYGWQALWNEI